MLNRITQSLLLLLLAALPLSAQEPFTDYLQRTQAGGIVILHQDAEIDQLVNGTNNRLNRKPDTTMGDNADEEEVTPMPPSGRHTTANGYRVQIISLGSTAKDKTAAETWGKKCKVYFPATNVYVSFLSPHYVCRLGDFRIREEAAEMLQQVKATNQFGSASIVRSKINVYY